jgi:small GTP-binding protein
MDTKIKIAVIGDIATGKSALLSMMVQEKFIPIYKPTIGVDLKVLNIPERNSKMVFWDLSGSENFENITETFINKVDIVMFCFAVDNHSSYTKMEKLYNEYNRTGLLKNKYTLVAVTKMDRGQKSQDAVSFSEKYKVDYIYTSVASKIGRQELINYILSILSYPKN